MCFCCIIILVKKMKYEVKKKQQLLPFLIENIKDLSNKKIKSLLKYGNILINNHVHTEYNYLLKKGDIVSIKEYKTKKHNEELKIIYEDKNIIVIDKPAGLLTISTNKEKEKTLYHMVSDYIKYPNKNNKIFVIHRLDRDTSGIVMFAKTEKIKKVYQNNWNEIVKKRNYIAIIEGHLTKKKGVISLLLKEIDNMVYVDKYGKTAITNYQVIKENEKYSMLKIDIKTGRKNQIRVHLKEIGHPIIGDKKYGSNINPIKRLALHANILEIQNPLTKKIERYESKEPISFEKMMK